MSVYVVSCVSKRGRRLENGSFRLAILRFRGSHRYR